LQFETTLRQRDVIGEWEPIAPGAERSGILLNGRRWVNGLTWSDISPELTFVVAHDPFVYSILSRVPAHQRIGPLIIDEKAGRPYAAHAYTREWRSIARATGVPDHVWDMDARASGMLEGDEAGADLDMLRSAAGHTRASTTRWGSRARSLNYVRHTVRQRENTT